MKRVGAVPALPRLSVLRNTKAAIVSDGGLFVVLSGMPAGKPSAVLFMSDAGSSAAITLRSLLSFSHY